MDPRRDIPKEIAVASRRWRTRLDERLRVTGLTQARWFALLALSKSDGGLTQRELAERIGIESATLVRHLDGLEQDGLVQRCALDGDRRAKLVRLTEAAAPVLEQITAIADQLRDELLEGVRPEEMQACLAVLRRVNERLERS